MLRTVLCVGVALFVCANLAQAKGKKDTGPVIGTIKSVDAAAGTLTVTMTSKKKGSTDKDFTISDTTKIIIDGDTPKELKGKEGLKDPTVKEGATVKVTCDSGGVCEVAVGGTYAKKKKKDQ